MGGCSIDATGVPLTDEAIATALDSDAVLMGSIGGNTATSPWYKLAPELRPEAGLLKLRSRSICLQILDRHTCTRSLLQHVRSVAISSETALI